jgi:hypothetical protein
MPVLKVVTCALLIASAVWMAMPSNTSPPGELTYTVIFGVVIALS